MNNCFMPNVKLDCALCPRNDIVDVVYRELNASLRENSVPGTHLVSVRKMARKLGIAPQTMQKVYSRLESDGLIARRSGKRLWNLCGQTEAIQCFGIVLPTSFARYFQPGTEYGERHFRMYSGIVERASELGFSTMPLQLPPPDASGEQISTALWKIRRKCSGIVHFGNRGFRSDPPLERLLACEDLAQVSFNCEFPHRNVGVVAFDPVIAVSMLLSYVRAYGHTRFAFVLPWMDAALPRSVRYRLQSFAEIKELFHGAGIPEKDLFVMAFPDNGRAAFRKELHGLLYRKDPPTVFWCRNDEIAIELIRIIREEGFQVPRDFSVMGFNNLQEAEHSDPPLSTFNNPFYEMGITIADHLLSCLKNGKSGEKQEIKISPFLVPRASVGPNRIRISY